MITPQQQSQIEAIKAHQSKWLKKQQEITTGEFVKRRFYELLNKISAENQEEVSNEI